jgi:hypothetical protein
LKIVHLNFFLSSLHILFSLKERRKNRERQKLTKVFQSGGSDVGDKTPPGVTLRQKVAYNYNLLFPANPTPPIVSEKELGRLAEWIEIACRDHSSVLHRGSPLQHQTSRFAPGECELVMVVLSELFFCSYSSSSRHRTCR